MLYYRRKLLLSLFEVFGGELTSNMLQKYLFIATRSIKTKSFDFVPLKSGCFSFQADRDLSSLETLGYLYQSEIENYCTYKLKEGTSMLSELDIFDRQILISLRTNFGNLSEDELTKYSYKNYPFFAINSTNAKDLLSEDEYQNISIQKVRLQKSETALYTIGYEGLSLESYLTQLILKDVRVLCDVRKNAYSRKFGFSKAVLKKACNDVGIKYVHIPELGIDSEQRQDLKNQEDYINLFNIYEITALKVNWSYLDIILNYIKSEKRVALTCFEKNHLMCHRSRVAKAVISISENIPLKNI